MPPTVLAVIANPSIRLKIVRMRFGNLAVVAVATSIVINRVDGVIFPNMTVPTYPREWINERVCTVSKSLSESLSLFRELPFMPQDCFDELAAFRVFRDLSGQFGFSELLAGPGSVSGPRSLVLPSGEWVRTLIRIDFKTLWTFD